MPADRDDAAYTGAGVRIELAAVCCAALRWLLALLVGFCG
jgi:hypothetical protein